MLKIVRGPESGVRSRTGGQGVSCRTGVICGANLVRASQMNPWSLRRASTRSRLGRNAIERVGLGTGQIPTQSGLPVQEARADAPNAVVPLRRGRLSYPECLHSLGPALFGIAKPGVVTGGNSCPSVRLLAPERNLPRLRADHGGTDLSSTFGA